MPEISRLNQQISAVMFENSGTTVWNYCHFGVLWFESKLLATGSSSWNVANCYVVKVESALLSCEGTTVVNDFEKVVKELECFRPISFLMPYMLERKLLKIVKAGCLFSES